MKQIYVNIIKWILPVLIVSYFLGEFTGCTDEFDGNGIDSILWTGSRLPEDSMYINPVFEPDLTKPSVFRGAGGYYAYGNENEWSAGFSLRVPLLLSKNLMNWDLKGEAFPSKPLWGEGKITSISIFYSTSLKVHLMFYNLGEAIGLAYSESALGPFKDYGKVIDKESVGTPNTLDPFFTQVTIRTKVGPRWVITQKNILFFGKNEGIYGVELDIAATTTGEVTRANKLGSPFQIAGNSFSRAYIANMEGRFYFIGTSGQEGNTHLSIAISDSIKGPYLNKEGVGIMTGQGTPFIIASSGNQYQSPGNAGGLIADINNNLWIIYNAIDTKRPQLPSGTERRYLMLSPVKLDSNGWPNEVIEVKSGWCKPKVGQ